MTPQGFFEATQLGDKIKAAGGFDFVYHDGLQRCYQTAIRLCSQARKDFGPRPWNMGPEFQGKPITKDSLARARDYITTNHGSHPPGGESFNDWYGDWMTFLAVQEYAHFGKKVGIVTHNRNIQTVYSIQGGQFSYKLYDCEGPGFLSVHVVDRGEIAPWNEKEIRPGIYLIRHAATSWGT
jgi:broad specificity phosphatase PhoE